jgi:hypothetical protein
MLSVSVGGERWFEKYNLANSEKAIFFEREERIWTWSGRETE